MKPENHSRGGIATMLISRKVLFLAIFLAGMAMGVGVTFLALRQACPPGIIKNADGECYRWKKVGGKLVLDPVIPCPC